MFSRRHVVVELAPHLYGQAPRLLDALVDRALADPEAVPIICVAGARERVYALGQLTAALQHYRAGAGEPARRWLEAQRSASALAGGLDAYRDQLDGLARPAGTPMPAPAAQVLPRPSPAYGPVT